MKNRSVNFGEDVKVCMNAEPGQGITLVEASHEIRNLLEEAKSDLMEIGGVMFGVGHQEEGLKDFSCLLDEMENNIVELKRLVETLKLLKQWLY